MGGVQGCAETDLHHHHHAPGRTLLRADPALQDSQGQ